MKANRRKYSRHAGIQVVELEYNKMVGEIGTHALEVNLGLDVVFGKMLSGAHTTMHEDERRIVCASRQYNFALSLDDNGLDRSVHWVLDFSLDANGLVLLIATEIGTLLKKDSENSCVE